LVPYAKPSIQLADKIIDRVLELAAKPIQIARGTATSIGRKATECKEAIAKNVNYSKKVISATRMDCKVSATIKRKQVQEWLTEKRSALMHASHKLLLSVNSKLGQVASWTSKQFHALLARLRLKELWGMACEKASALKKSVSEVGRDRISAWKNYATASVQQGMGKAHASMQRVLGSGQVDKPKKFQKASSVA